MTTRTLRSKEPTSWLRRAPALGALALALLGPSGATAGSDDEIDFAITGAEYTVADGEMTLLIQYEDRVPYGDADWFVPIRILFNGELFEVDHGVTSTVTTGPQICLAPTDGECEQPETPCAKTYYTYKSAEVDSINWSCVFEANGPGPADDDCACRKFPFRPATLPKSFSAPTEPGTFELIVDPDDLFAETDEANNILAFEFEPVADVPYPAELEWIEVVFVEGSIVRLRDGELVDFGPPALPGVADVLAPLDFHEWQRLSSVSEEDVDALRQQGMDNTGGDVPDLNNIYRLRFAGADVWELAASLEALPGVSLARPVPLPVELPVPPPFEQEYRAPAAWNPSGMGHDYFLLANNGDGTGAYICDIEYGWNYDHADISKALGSQIGTNVALPPGFDDHHGTAVAGLLVADDNGWGVTGLCSGANFRTSGSYFGTPTPTWNPAGAILTAISHMPPGSVILLEQQWNYDDPGTANPNDFIPIEWWMSVHPQAQTHNAVYQAIELATANLQYVVEPAGNGFYDLDGMPIFGDSGAIIVGAGGTGTGAGNLERLDFSTSGFRVNLQGWGENVVTTGYGNLYEEGVTDDLDYTATFAGTSSASAHVAAAVACYSAWITPSQGVVSPSVLRDRFALNGTNQVNIPAGHIGPRPDLLRLYVLEAPPPIRDGGDYGDAPEGVLAYPNGVVGAFPTVFGPTTPVDYMMHVNQFGLRFGATLDWEYEGNAGLPFLSYYTYDADECQNTNPINDDGLLFPTAFTIDGGGNVVRCSGNSTPLGNACGQAVWGTDIDIEVSCTLPQAWLNVLIDWNQDGVWGGVDMTCGAPVPELAVENVPIPGTAGVAVPLSQLVPGLAPIDIGPVDGFVWARFTLTDAPLPFPASWDGGLASGGWGLVPLGETEDYLLAVGDVVDVAGGAPPVHAVRLAARPNPFRAGTELRFALDESADVSLEIFDVSGRRVRTLMRGRLGAGAHTETWDGRDDQGARVATGVYFARLRGTESPQTIRLNALR